MKNFTKQFANKALFKPTRWLLVALMFLLGTSGAWAATVTFTSDDILYFNMSAVSWWTAGSNGNGNFAYFYNNSTGKNAWSAHAVQYSGSVYYVKIPAGTWEGVILTRNNTSTSPSWNNKWNQTGDIALSSTSNYISKFSEGSASVTWSTQKPASTGALAATSTSVEVGTNVTLTPSLTSNTTYNEIKSTSYAISPSTGASVSGNTFTATAAGTYTVTATITYNPRGYSSLTSTVSPTVTITVTKSCETVSASQYTIKTTEYTWDGQAKKPTVSAKDGAGEPTSTVYKQGDTEVASPTNVGIYDVYVSSNDGATYCGADDLKVGSFEITCKSGKASDLYTLTKASEEYVGAPRGTGVTPVPGAGTVASISYKQGDIEVSPINVGTYDVYITSNAGTGYCAITTPTKIGTFEVTCKTATASQYTISQTSYTYDGSAKKPTVSKANGATAAGAVTSTVYKQGDTQIDNPINADTYDIYITTEAGTGYCALTNFKLGSFIINGKAPAKSDFTYTEQKDYTGTVLSADVAWKTGLAAGTGGAITTYYKKEGAADNTYTTTKPSAVGVYTIAVTTAAGGNYAAATTKIELGDFTINEVCDPITNLTWSITSGEKATYCPGDKVQVTLEYSGTTAKNHSVSGNNEGLSFAISSLANGAVYNITVNKTSTILLTLTGCDGKPATTPTLTFNVMEAPATPTVKVVNNIIKCGNDFTEQGKIQITNYNPDYSYKIGVNNDPLDPSAIDNDGNISGLTIADKFTLYAINSCGVATPSEAFTITETNNKPTITGNNSFQPGGSTVLTSDKGANTIWKADKGTLSAEKGESVTFSADTNGKYIITAIYNGCETEFVVSVQDDLYVWMRRPIKKETAYTQFYHEDQNSSQGGDLYYLEFASKPGSYKDYNHGGVKAEKNCTDKDGYMWYGFKISKTAIENEYYFTVHAPNDGGKKGDSEKWGGYYTHTKVTRFDKDMTSDLYFVMDEVESGSSDGWNINAPVVVRASGDASFNGNNFADFVPLYVKDANICGKEVVSFEWQKSASENGAYTTYKSGKGINNIRTREAGWYRCVVTYGDGKGTATSNAIEVKNAGGTSYSFTSNLPIVMVNTNGVGFPDECTIAGKSKYPSAVADDLKAKISVDVIIKKGDNILYDKKARMNYRGSSSLNFKKKSYAFVSGQDSCVFDKSRHDYVKTKKAKMLNILGQSYDANDKDWVMYAATADPSMIRNRLVFDLYQKMRPNDWGVHSTYVELVVDGEYKGVYVFMDKITANEKRVNIVDGTGFIVKWDKTDVADRYVDGNDKDSDEKTFATTRTGKKGIGTYGTTVDQLFEIEYPEKEDIVDEGGSWSSTVETIKQRFEDFETALEAKNYEQVRAIIDYDSWADWFILNEFTKNLDAYRASCIFTCKGQGYKIQATPLWDQELSFNNAAANISGKGANSTSGLLIQHGGVYGDGDEKFTAPFWFTGGGTSITGGLLNDPCFVSLVKEKWATYTADGGVLTSAKVNEMVDAYKADLGAIGTAGTPIYRENAMIPFDNNTNAGRGATSSCTGSQAIGYFGYGANCGSAVSHDNSITAIKNWIPSRITGLSSALEPLKGEALIFLVSPAEQDVTPWQTALVSVQAPSGYTYTIDYSAITAAGGEVKNANNIYSVKLPRPSDWEIGGNGNNTLAKDYEIKASIELDDEGNTCGVTATMETKTATITLKDEIEACDPIVTR